MRKASPESVIFCKITRKHEAGNAASAQLCRINTNLDHMKKTVYKYGIIAGMIVSLALIVTAIVGIEDVMMGNWGMVVGFGSMLIAFSFIFVAVKSYRDTVANGSVTFGKALSIGLLISLIASTFYVATWVVEYYTLFPDFMDKYIAATLEKAKAGGASAAELQQQARNLDTSRQIYSTPFGIILFTYMEILPVGILVSLIAALVLKRRQAGHAAG